MFNRVVSPSPHTVDLKRFFQYEWLLSFVIVQYKMISIAAVVYFHNSKLSCKEVWCDTSSIKFFLSFNLCYNTANVFLTCVNPRGQLYKIKTIFSTRPQKRYWQLWIGTPLWACPLWSSQRRATSFLIFLLRLTIVYIFLHWSLKLNSGVLKPSYQHALLLTSLFVYYELKIISFERRKFYLFLVISSPILLRIVSSWTKF